MNVSFLLLVASSLLLLSLVLIVWAAAVRVARQEQATRYLGADKSAARAPERETGWADALARRGAAFDRLIGDAEETRRLLLRAGIRGARARAGYYILQTSLPLAAAGLAIAALGLLPVTTVIRVLIVLGLLIVGLLLPRFLLRRRAAERCKRIEADVPLFINLMILLFDAGLNLRQALTSLVRDGRGTMQALVEELDPIVRQIQAGAQADALLRETGKDLDIDDLELVLGILRQVERYGGEVKTPLTEALQTMQAQRTMATREQVNILSGKMTVVLVTCFFPPLLIFIAGPAFVSISRSLGGL